MSVIFSFIHEDFIAVCADKQATDLTTENPHTALVTKIHLWSPYIGVGHGGNYFIGKEILKIMQEALPGGAENYSLEELAEYVFEVYQILRSQYDFIADEEYAECIFAGTLSNGSLGLIYTRVGGGDPVKEIYTADTNPVVMVVPYDMQYEECYQLFKKAVQSTAKKKIIHQDVYERAYRKAVRYVSEHSNYVGHKSDYLEIKRRP